MTMQHKTKHSLRRAAIGSRRGSGLFSRGQAIVEFAIIAGVALLIMLVGIQFALIGQCALAVSQLSESVARFASVNPTNSDVTSTAFTKYINEVASPTLLNNKGADLSVTMPTACPPSNSFSSPVTITVQYNLASKLFLPNPFLGVSFPTTVQSTQTAFCEGD